MLNTATFSSVKKNHHWSRTERCPILGSGEEAYICRENEEMFLWQVHLKEWHLPETAEGDSIVQWMLGERGYWPHDADRHGHVINGKACEKCTCTHF